MNIEYPGTEVIQQITPNQAWHYRIFPKSISSSEAVFYSDNGEEILDELEILLGKPVVLKNVDTNLITEFLSKYYRKEIVKQSQNLSFDGDSKNFIAKLIAEAKNIGSSDIHIEAYENKCRVRIRIDGKLIERFTIASKDYAALINKIKIMANLDIAEKRLPQDGRIFFNQYGSKFDIRVSILPTLHGEKVVMRILSNDASNIDIEKLGFKDNDLKKYLDGVKRPNGIILISGPTGSGKTTTLYATLKLLNEISRNITTIEDPIEYTLDGINQVQLKENIGLDFASAMRTFLRQDPDVIMVGEIRDPSTANMAIRASLTGHLVLSTIHTNSAWGTVSRLVDMGIPGYLVANTLNLSIAQRLVRQLCSKCKEKVSLSTSELPDSYEAKIIPNEHYIPKGCEECYFTGYKGRTAIYEVIPIDRDLANEIKLENLNLDTLLEEKGIISLSDNAYQLFMNGETSLEEIYPLLMN